MVMNCLIKSFLLLFLIYASVNSSGILYPRASEVRQILSLDGLWNFALTPFPNSSAGLKNKWYKKNLTAIPDIEVELMPVPSSYNDITTSWDLREYVGPVWYQREFFVPTSWNTEQVWIRFSSVCYSAVVWINGESAVSHQIGHLPFQANITSLLKFGEANTITVSVDNTLTDITIPQGASEELNSGRIKQTYTFDFFNYAGIDRPVTLYTTPKTYIDDITITTDIVNGTNGIVRYDVLVKGTDEVSAKITLLDQNGIPLTTSTSLQGMLTVAGAKFWWPYLMDSNPGYLYSLQVELLSTSGVVVDKYKQPVGIRTVTWDATTLKINNRSVYLRGFGRHEDSDIRGKGLDLPLIIRDHNLIKWVGANSYRTSHYPYAEEIMDLADQLGIMIIDESPAVNTEGFKDDLLLNHKQSLTELIQRDKNRPGVIMWSASNEPRTQDPLSEAYYQNVIAHIKSLDSNRPVTVVNNQRPNADHSAQFVDIASFNLYRGWYENAGDLDIITMDVLAEARAWYKKHNKPVLITEYGGDTQEGLHFLPTYIWSEEFQVQLMSKHFEAFDQLRIEGFFVGEMIWNFADFKTAQSITRVGGNKKGIFTRNRQPKASAHFMRKRYWSLANALDGVKLPDDLNDYIFSNTKVRDEL